MSSPMRERKKPYAWLHFVISLSIFGAAVVLACTGPLHDHLASIKLSRDVSEMKSLASRRTSWPVWMKLPPPETLILVEGALGRFRIPLNNFAGRDEFRQPPSQPLGDWKAAPDGSHLWDSFTLAFWMPDGAGVQTEASELLRFAYFDFETLKWHRDPLRPREKDRPDPSSNRYVVVVGAFCPMDGSRPKTVQGGTIFFYGYGAGTGLDVCNNGRTDSTFKSERYGWQLARSTEDVQLYCSDSLDYCYGYIVLPLDKTRALVFLPIDSIGQVGLIAARIHALLEGWHSKATAE